MFYFQFYLKGKSKNKTKFIHTRNCNKFFSHREGNNNVNSHSFLLLCSGNKTIHISYIICWSSTYTFKNIFNIDRTFKHDCNQQLNLNRSQTQHILTSFWSWGKRQWPREQKLSILFLIWNTPKSSKPGFWIALENCQIRILLFVQVLHTAHFNSYLLMKPTMCTLFKITTTHHLSVLILLSWLI